MSSFPGSLHVLKGSTVPIDADSLAVQYNPGSLTRPLQVQAVSADGGDRSEEPRLKNPPVEPRKLEAKIDATSQLRSRRRAVLDTESKRDFEKADRT